MVDFPTRVGMARIPRGISKRRQRFPHPRGDGPEFAQQLEREREISPPAWGWPVGTVRRAALAWDFPTRVGMARRET